MNAAEAETLKCLFFHGPTMDGNLPSKFGMAGLVDRDMAYKINGWNYLTGLGVQSALDRGLDREKQSWEQDRRDLSHANAEKRGELEDDVATLKGALNNVYKERNMVVVALASIAYCLGWPVGIKSTAIEGWDEEWNGCLYLDLPTGQCSWHYPTWESLMFAHFPPYERAWDGHDTASKYQRVLSLTLPENMTAFRGIHDAMLAALENLENDDGQAMPPSAWDLVQSALRLAGSAKAQPLTEKETV